MRFEKLTLRQFRNYPLLEMPLCEGTTVLFGENGSGKTNLLEAMHLLSLGRSHRTLQDREMVQTGQEESRVLCEARRIDGLHQVEIILQPKQKPKKRAILYGKPAHRIGDLMGHATVVMFSPEDLRIVRDGPTARRRFIDMQLSQIKPGYLNALKRYLSVLENRNALLREQKLAGVRDFANLMDAWDEQLALAAVPIIRARRGFLKQLSENASREYESIAETSREPFATRYLCAVHEDEDIAQAMLQSLQRMREEDVQRMFTYFGPQRDDLALTLCGQDLRAFGSQGQLRTAVLSLKLGEIQLIREEMGEPPTLLLDDVFSELDFKRRRALIKGTEGVQTVLTCTDRKDAAEAKAEAFVRVFRKEDGSAAVENCP